MDIYSIDFLNVSNLSYSNKFKLYYDIMSDPNNIYVDSHHAYYIYMSSLTENDIDIISKLKINQYLFFKYLPNIDLIKKYYTNDSNKIHGITKNENITKDERYKILGELMKNN
jgi:hypothetical protein